VSFLSDWYLVSSAVYVLGFLVTIYMWWNKQAKPQGRPARNKDHMVWNLVDIFNIVHLSWLSNSQHFWDWPITNFRWKGEQENLLWWAI